MSATHTGFSSDGGTTAARDLALVALSHSVTEHRLYLRMLGTRAGLGPSDRAVDLRRVVALCGSVSTSSARRASASLVRKLSIEPVADAVGSRGARYRAFEAWEVLARREAAGIEPFPSIVREFRDSRVFDLVAPEVLARNDLSRRETIAALCCVEGLSNATIGRELGISEKTVKFHVRNLFEKVGARRRAELLGCLLRGESAARDADESQPRARAACEP